MQEDEMPERVKAKIQEENGKLGVIIQCCVCHRYQTTKGRFIVVTPEEEFIYEHYYRISSTYCSRNCMIHSGIPEEQADRIYARLEDEG